MGWVVVRWDPQQYLQFEAERGRPFHDLLARVRADAPSYVVDLGCGPGNLTRTLADRWPGAEIKGIDSSVEMVERARRENAIDGVSFSVGDLRDWNPSRPVDVLISNATLQWVPRHLELLPQLVDAVAPDGWFAVQVPGNFDEPSHTELATLSASDRWRSVLGEQTTARAAVEEPVTLLERLSALGCLVDAWETTYLHVLPGDDAVLEWMKGTGLRPVLSDLDEQEQEQFLADYGARLRRVYPRQSFGTVLPFRRIFVVARKGAAR